MSHLGRRTYERPKRCRVPTSSQVPLKRSSYSHILHSNSSQWWKYIHRKTQKQRSGEGLCMTHNNVVFSFVPPPHWHTHTYICSHTAAVLHYAITPTLWSVKERKPRSNSLRTPTAPSVLTQQPPPLWAQVCLRVWRIGGRRHFILHMHISTDTQPLTHTHTHMERCCHQSTQPRQCINPSHQLGEQESKRDIKMWRWRQTEKAWESDGGRITGEKRVRDVLTLVFVFIKWVWMKGFRRALLAEDSRAEGVWDTWRVSYCSCCDVTDLLTVKMMWLCTQWGFY